MFRTIAPAYGFAVKNLKLIKLRMKAVDSIKKITKAMKMVAAAKMKQDVGRLEKGKGFGVGSLNKVFDNESYLQKKKPTFANKKTLLVPITTDRGLCGGTNSSVIRQVKAIVKNDHDAYKLFVVGDKGSLALVRICPELVHTSITNLLTPMNFPTAASIANYFVKDSADCDRIVIIYNEFKNVISQILRKLQILSKKDFQRMFKLVFKHKIVHPGPQYSSHYFYDFYVCSAFYNALLNNLASEQSSRMNAMENASKNAGQIVDKLTLDFNKVRQSKITQELSEIVSGAAAV